MFTLHGKAKLDREQKTCDEIAKHLRMEQSNQDDRLNQLAKFDLPRCGMELHGPFSRENRMALEKEIRSHDHDIKRVQDALQQQIQKCNTLQARQQRRIKSKRADFAFLTSFF